MDAPPGDGCCAFILLLITYYIHGTGGPAGLFSPDELIWREAGGLLIHLTDEQTDA